MTFDEVVTEITARLNLTSTEATARVGREVNRYYKRVTTAIGMNNTRREVDAVQSTTVGSDEITFTGVEKVTRVYITTGGSKKKLDELTYNEMRDLNIVAGTSTKWATQSMGATTVTVKLNALEETVRTLYADGYTTVSTLSGTQVPAFPESFHDILVEGVLQDEYKKKGSRDLARDSKLEYEQRLSDLRMWNAKNGYLKNRQGLISDPASHGSGFSTGSTGAGGAGIDADTVDGWHYNEIIDGFNVRDYGAEADGSDDADAFDLTTAAAIAAGGGAVLVPPGTYRLSRALSALGANNVRFVGYNRETCILEWDDTADRGLLIDTTSNTSVASNLTVDCTVGDYTVTVVSGTGFVAGEWAYLEDGDSTHGSFLTKIKSVAGAVITLEEASPVDLPVASTAILRSYVTYPLLEGVVVRDLTFSCVNGASTANKLSLLFLSRLHDVIVERCHFNGSVGPLVTTRALKNGVIRDCTFENALTIAGSAIEAQTSTGLTITDCQAQHCQFGFVAARSPRTKMIGLTASASPIPPPNAPLNIGRPLKVSAGANFSVVQGCTLSDSNLTGMRVENASYCTIGGNTVLAHSFEENGAGGIQLGGDAVLTHHNTVTGNMIYGGNANAVGIALSYSAAGVNTYNVIVGNNCTGCLRYGIYVGSNYNTITGNHFGSDDTFAILYVPASCGYNTIDDNVFVREGANTPVAIHSVDGVGGNLIGINKFAGSLTLDDADTVVASTIWKVPTATQTSVNTGANTTETTAWTVTIPANTFVTYGPSLGSGFTMSMFIVAAATANAKTIKVKFGTTVTFTFALSATSGNNGNIVIHVDAFRNGAAIVLTAQCLVMDISAGTVLYLNNVSGTSSDDLSTAVNVVVTLTNGVATASDLQFKSGKFVYEGVIIRPTPVS